MLDLNGNPNYDPFKDPNNHIQVNGRNYYWGNGRWQDKAYSDRVITTNSNNDWLNRYNDLVGGTESIPARAAVTLDYTIKEKLAQLQNLDTRLRTMSSVTHNGAATTASGNWLNEYTSLKAQYDQLNSELGELQRLRDEYKA